MAPSTRSRAVSASLLGRLRQHEQELVGAVAADQVAAAQLRRERRRPVAEHLVAAVAAGLSLTAAKSSRSSITKVTWRS